MIPRLCVASTFAVVLPGSLLAQTAVELSYGLNLTSNYVGGGETQAEGPPALQGYVEGAYGLFYGGVWASNIDPDDGDQVEFNLYAGIQPSIGEFDFNLNYTRYVYAASGDCCGEIILLAAYPVSDFVGVGGGFSYDPQADTTWVEVATAVAFADVWEVDGTIGTDFGGLESGESREIAWDLGIERSLGDVAWVDLRFYEFEPGTVDLGHLDRGRSLSSGRNSGQVETRERGVCRGGTRRRGAGCPPASKRFEPPQCRGTGANPGKCNAADMGTPRMSPDCAGLVPAACSGRRGLGRG